MKPFLKWHLGLGDAIICAPLAVELAKLHDGLTVPCYDHNLISVQSLFANYPYIDVIPFTNEFRVHEYVKKHPLIIPIGFYKETPQLPGETFDRFFYRTAGVNFEYRWGPVVEKACQAYVGGPESDPIFIHEDRDRGFIISPPKVIEHGLGGWSKDDKKIGVVGFSYSSPGKKDGSILEHFNLLMTAKQIHVIDSSFLHLVESLPVTAELFLHRYARPTNRPEDQVELRKKWKILE